MRDITSCFLIHVKENSEVSGYNISNSAKRIFSLKLLPGIYLCFIEDTLLSKEIDDQFCETLYNNTLLLLRYKDIIKLVI